MTPTHVEQIHALMRPQFELADDASIHLQAIVAVLNSKPRVYKERAVLKSIEGPLESLKSAQDQERIAFVFEALKYMTSHKDIFLAMAVKAAAAEILRKGIPLNCLDALRL